MQCGACSDVDFKGETDWWQKYFSSLTPVAADTGHSELLLQNNTVPYKSSYRTFTCSYNPVSTGAGRRQLRRGSTHRAKLTQADDALLVLALLAPAPGVAPDVPPRRTVHLEQHRHADAHHHLLVPGALCPLVSAVTTSGGLGPTNKSGVRKAHPRLPPHRVPPFPRARWAWSPSSRPSGPT